MFEEVISALQGMEVGFEEMPEQGMLSVEVGQMDKMQLIEVLNMVNSMGMTVTELTDSTMMISSGATPQPVAEENTADDAAQQAALDEALSGM